MVEDLQIGRYTPADQEQLAQLWQRCDLIVPWNDAGQDIAEFHARRQATLLLGRLGDRVVASAAAAYDGHRGWLYYVAVAPDLRRHGFGRSLVAEAERWLAARGARKVQLMIRPGNAQVRRFYAAIGYHAAPRLIMQRWLTPPATGEYGQEGEATLTVSITRLELEERPKLRHAAPPSGKLALIRAEPPTLSYYRYLYERVGERWFWWERRVMTDVDLAVIIEDPQVEIYVLYAQGVPAGFAELDLRRLASERIANIAYLGLMPEFIGRGYGHYLLDWSVDAALRHAPRRVTVNTCNLDHPRAVAFYQQAGFAPVRQEEQTIRDPRLEGIIPPETPLPPAYAPVADFDLPRDVANVTPILRGR